MTATSGVLGRCAHCQTFLDLEPWQLNAMAMQESFNCIHCHKPLRLDCPEQIKRLKSLGSFATLRAMMIVLCATVLLVTLVLEWVGLLSLRQQLSISALMLGSCLLVLVVARRRQRRPLLLQGA
ncbi:hypothetical protein GV819_09135 [Pseudomonas sp. Fl5BN2]|uniref:hypothetical protein n=1 Tax=unclassified Pseudomonas TaxID=196821 RepID=UPI001376DCC9|nr:MULTISPECIES: hypothetical protein [unclassified Pseudomonas]NBF02458.1 hypothetical protein [Pseudomonas sp. Fl5BN2]NBF11366.1 hypothetical protein [Pseudomonas sp. Fl4BN1]